MSSAVFPIFIVLVIAIMIPFIVGFYVYQDARRRGMNVILWTFVAAAAPALIGLIVYLLVRGNYSDLRCPKCDTPVKEQFVVCPKCRTKLHASCPNCAMPVESDWIVCPKCTQPLADVQMDVQIPVRTKDKSIWKVLAVVLILPVLLITMLVLSLSAFFSAGASSFAVTTLEEYKAEINSETIESDVQKWMSNLDLGAECAYALQYHHTDGDNTQYFYLIFVPGADSYIEMGESSSIFGTTITLGFQNTGNKGNLFHVVSSADKAPNLKIKLDGKKIPCRITTVDYNPTLYYIVPDYDEVEPDATDVFMPERISVVRIINNHNEGVVEIEDEDMALDILVGIDSAPYLELEHDIYPGQNGIGGYEFKDGFEIIIEYKVHEDLVLHEDMLTCTVLEQNDGYYILDGRPDNGRFIREIDKSFYNELIALFE